MSTSIAPECNEAKERYDNCFLNWYSEKFIKGKATTDECAPLLDAYKECLTKHLKDKGIDKLIEGARESGNESDHQIMRDAKRRLG